MGKPETPAVTEPLTGDDLIRNLLDIAQKRAESAQEKRFVLDPATWPTPHRHYNDVRVNDCGHDLHYGWLEIAQEIEDVQQLMDFIGVPDGLPQGKGDADWRVAVAVVELMDARERLSRIALNHSQERGDSGMVGSFCVECEHLWPCPTYRFANGDAGAGRMPNYPAPITPAETHPDGCIGCKVEKGPHKWTPPTAAPFCDPDCEVDLATGRCIFCGHPREVEGA